MRMSATGVRKMRRDFENIESQAIAPVADGPTKIDADGTIINLVGHIGGCVFRRREEELEA